MKKVTAILLVAVMCLTLLCACGKSEKASQLPDGLSQELVDRFKGDWNGCVAFVDGTGKYEDLTGIVGAIARLNVDEKGNITPFIGLDVEDTPIEELTAVFDSDEVVISGKWISAEFKDIHMHEYNGTLSVLIPVSKEAGSVSLAFNFRRLDDTGWTDEEPGMGESQINECMGKSFDELAEMIGYSKSDYPEAMAEAAPVEENTKKDSGSKSEKGSIVGSWTYVDGGYTYTFNSNGTGSYTAGTTVMEFTYEDDGSKVSILYTGNTMPSEYAYTISGDILSIEDSFGEKVEYKKQ